MIFSSDGRRLVTSLIVVITTVIILILLVVNLNCIIFTEATVNTTTSTSSFISQTTTQPTPTHNPVNVTTTTATIQVAANSKVVLPLETGLAASLGISDNIITGKPVVLTKIKDPSSNLTSGSGGGMANTVSTTDINSQMAHSNNNLINDSNISTMNDTTNSTSSSSSISNSSSSSQDASHESPCPLAEIDKVVNTTNPNSNDTMRYFDIDYAVKTFQDSMVDRNSISLYHYLNGFKELMKFFHSLGSIFLFVTSDLESKISLLEGYRSTEKGGCNPAYLTIQSTVEFETKENLLRDSKRQSGARTILRLHRALEFLSALMMNLSKLDDESETAPAARDAYSNTLARHHPWTIRTIASFAMRTLPHKKNLVESVLGKEKATNNTLTNEKMLVLSNVTDTLFNVVDKYYEENDLKDLP